MQTGQDHAICGKQCREWWIFRGLFGDNRGISRGCFGIPKYCTKINNMLRFTIHNFARILSEQRKELGSFRKIT